MSFGDFSDSFKMPDGTEVDLEVVDGSDVALMLVIRPNGAMKLHVHVPPYVTVALLAQAAEVVAERHGLGVNSSRKRFELEAAHGPLGRPSDN